MLIVNPFAAAVGATDPYFANVVTLLHLDSNFSCQIGRTYNVVTPTISSAQSKFGGASALFNGSSDYFDDQAGADTDFDIMSSGTAECWIYPTAISATMRIFGNTSNHFQGWSLYIGSAGSLWSYAVGYIESANGVVTTNNWQHIAIDFNAGVATIYVNGVSVVSGATSNNTSTSPFRVGANAGGTNNFQGYIDEVRVTNGTRRYTSGFTPPAAAFPNS